MTARRALIQCCGILLSIVVHEAMALLHVRGLLLWDGAQHRLPEASKRCWDIEVDGGWDGKVERRKSWDELSGEAEGGAGEGGRRWRGEAWEEGEEGRSGGCVDGRHRD